MLLIVHTCFLVDDVLYGHKAILCARSEVIAAMFSGLFNGPDSLESTVLIICIYDYHFSHQSTFHNMTE